MKRIIILILCVIGIQRGVSQNIIATQSVNGTVNGKKISANYSTSLNTITGKANTSISGSWNDDDLPTCFLDVTLCNITIVALVGQNGAENLSNYLEDENYVRSLTYTFSTGEKVTFSSKVNAKDLHSEVEIEGNFPKAMQADFLKHKKIELIKPATFDFGLVVMPPVGINLSYNGDLHYLIGDTEYVINVSTSYEYKGKAMPEGNKVIISKGITTVSDDGKSLSKSTIFTLTR